MSHSSFLLKPTIQSDLLEYVKGLGNSPSTTGPSDDTTHTTVLSQTIEDLLEVAHAQPLHEVRI